MKKVKAQQAYYSTLGPLFAFAVALTALDAELWHPLKRAVPRELVVVLP